jgi:hypothetical protein
MVNSNLFPKPILFLIFNRPDSTLKVFEEIKKAKPSRLYIAADGPRNEAENEKCKGARDVVNLIDWSCEIKTLYRESNLGCKNAISSAITWFFEAEEEGIILEDDCVPNQSFFSFCSELLDVYRNNDQIMHIGGSNFQPNSDDKTSYYFSNYNHVWGWATWRRAWSKYDGNLTDFPEYLNENRISKILGSQLIKYSWLYKFWKLYRNKIDTWDFQWTYTIWNNNGISITPTRNLVSNIGFNEEATHTKSKNDRVSDLRTEHLDIIVHPKNIEINYLADKITNKVSFGSSLLKNILFWMIVKSIRLKLIK